MIQSKHIKSPQLVLIVDDQEINRDVLGMILEDHYELIYACDGREAVQKIEAYQDKLSLIMLDLMMPEMDGFQVLSYVHESESLKRIPVIVLTAEKDAELRALQMGAADFITKPFDMHEVILARVGRIIELSEGRQLISAAEQDQLTLLYNRNFFFEYANRLFQYHPELRMDAVVMNIEQFHSINALNGRAFGDQVLCTLGSEIHAIAKETGGIAGRFEADRFDIYCRHREDYAALFDRLQHKLDELAPNANIQLRMGVMPWPGKTDPIQQFDMARTACSMARGHYKEHLIVFDEKIRQREIYEQRLLNDLKRALNGYEFEVYYQPKYDIQSNPPKLVSAEALVRWRHPELGMISPDEFIPLFERNGKISEVDKFVWGEAARQVMRWREQYGVTIPVSVNLSRVDVFDPNLGATLERILTINGLNHSDLKLEVTESAYTENAEQVIQVVEGLRKKGYVVEMDDFGTGYSSLNMLSAMPIDVLKMDKAFIQNIEHDEKDAQLVSLIINIAKSLKIPVVAEGVETETQMQLLKKLGCALVQGYYFSRPLHATDFEAMFIRKAQPLSE